MRLWVCSNKTLEARTSGNEFTWAFLVWLKSLNRSFITIKYINANKKRFAKSLNISVKRFDSLWLRAIADDYVYESREGIYRLKTTRTTPNDLIGVVKNDLVLYLRKRSKSRVKTNFKIEINSSSTFKDIVNELRLVLINNMQAKRLASAAKYLRDASVHVESNSWNPENGLSTKTISKRLQMSDSTVSKIVASKDRIPAFLGYIPKGYSLENLVDNDNHVVTVHRGSGAREIAFTGRVYVKNGKVYDRRATVFEKGDYNREVLSLLSTLSNIVIDTKQLKLHASRLYQVKRLYNHLIKVLRGIESTPKFLGKELEDTIPCSRLDLQLLKMYR